MTMVAEAAFSRRQVEVADVTEDRRHIWLAGQIDEVEDNFLARISELAAALDANTLEVSENTKVQVSTRERFTWLALSIVVTIFTTVVAGVVIAGLL